MGHGLNAGERGEGVCNGVSQEGVCGGQCVSGMSGGCLPGPVCLCSSDTYKSQERGTS